MTRAGTDVERACAELQNLLDAEPTNGLRAAEALLAVLEAGGADKLEESAIRATVELLGQIGRTAQRQLSEVLQPLARMRADCRATLESALHSPQAPLRWGAAYTLGHACGVSADLAEAIFEMLGDEDGDSRWAAAELACELARSDAGFADELRNATSADSSALRRMALYCLRDLDVADLADLAQQQLQDSDLHGRLAALSALSAAGLTRAQAETAIPALQHLLESDPEPGARRAAAVALGRILSHAGAANRSAATAALERASASEDSSLARAARKALAPAPHARRDESK